MAPAAGRGGPRTPCRQRLRECRSLTRAGTYGSSPVSRRNAAGICRRRATPSFARSASLCAFAVRAEIPRKTPTSSFEHPAAISATTSRWRSVSAAFVPMVALVMTTILVSLVRGIHSPEGVNPDVSDARRPLFAASSPWRSRRHDRPSRRSALRRGGGSPARRRSRARRHRASPRGRAGRVRARHARARARG